MSTTTATTPAVPPTRSTQQRTAPERPSPSGRVLPAELMDIHLEAEALVAELSTSPAWTDADQIVERLVAEADGVSGATSVPAPSVPAVVRCRELGVAHRHLCAALSQPSAARVPEAAIIRARALLSELVNLADDTRATLPR